MSSIRGQVGRSAGAFRGLSDAVSTIFGAIYRMVNTRLAFSIATVAIITSKAARIQCHRDALPFNILVRWGSSFFLQDTAALLVVHVIVKRAGNALVSCLVAGYLLVLAITHLSVIAMTGTELQWRNIALAGDSGSWAVLTEGIFSSAVVVSCLLLAAMAMQPVCHIVGTVAFDLVVRTLLWLPRKMWNRRLRLHGRYTIDDYPSDIESKGLNFDSPKRDSVDSAYNAKRDHSPTLNGGGSSLCAYDRRFSRPVYFVVGCALATQVLAAFFRPHGSATMAYMSWTLPLMPFAELMTFAQMMPGGLMYSGELNQTLHGTTALVNATLRPWMPKDVPLAGFEDWYEGNEHYSAAKDPLKMSNLNAPLLQPLRDLDLKTEVPIRHVMLVKLESTRKDVFPLKTTGRAYTRLAETFSDKTFPGSKHSFLANLTSTANFLTGDWDDGFQGSRPEPNPSRRARGGLNMKNAHTTSTYTFKSLTGSLCGLHPLAADFNVEYYSHVYQPCLPHIFNALNSLDHSRDAKPQDEEHDFTSFKWSPRWMQSVTYTYDKFDKLMPKFGMDNDTAIYSEVIKQNPKFANYTDINYFGLQEAVLEDYIREAFQNATQNNERLFLTHMTGTTHHAFGIPQDEAVVSLSDDKEWDDLSNYVNAVGYVDRWLSQLLGILEEESVANETLIVFAGDHGISVAEQGSVTAYGNANIGSYHVPLVVSHPKLPVIQVDDAVQSSQILPTVLDLLLETGSLSLSESYAVQDLIQNYEGQSLIRPMRKTTDTGIGGWQVTVMNPGGSTLAIRDARQPNWRLIVPFAGHYEWRFTDLTNDPHEDHTVASFELDTLMERIGGSNETTKSKWVEEAAVVAQWWAKENYRRWRYDA